MKGTSWLCPAITLLCASRFVCTSQLGYPQEYADSNTIQDNSFLEKRRQPSLSIVNPLDVLRQRLVLEIARRQMEDRRKQVEKNRAILHVIGKRIPHHRLSLATSSVSHLEEMPAYLIFDFLQQNAQEKKKTPNNLSSEVYANEIGNGPSPGIGTTYKAGPADEDDNDNDFELRYLYRLHRDHYGRK